MNDARLGGTRGMRAQRIIAQTEINAREKERNNLAVILGEVYRPPMQQEPRKMGRPKKPDSEKVQPLNLKLPPVLIGRLESIRAKRTWPETMKDLADRWEGASQP